MTTSSCEAEKYNESLVAQNSDVQSNVIAVRDALDEWELTDLGEIEFNKIFEKMESLIAEWIQETSCRLSHVSVTNDVSNSDNKKISIDSDSKSDKEKTPECLMYLGLSSGDYEEAEDEYELVKEIVDSDDDLENSGRKRRRIGLLESTERQRRERKRLKREKNRLMRTEAKDEDDELQFTKPRVYECDCCFKIFFHKVFYRRHMIRHIDRNPRCENCNEIFLSKLAKRYHRAQCRR